MAAKPRHRKTVVKEVHSFQHVKVNLWAMIQNLAIHAMNKGQLPSLAAAGLLALILYRTPEKDVGLILHRIFANLTTFRGIAYILVPCLALGWFFHARWQRKSIASEMDRIGREKTRLQEQLTKLNLASSSKKGVPT